MQQYYYDNSRPAIFPPATRHLLIINFLVFVMAVINQEFVIKYLAMFYPGSPYFRIWQPLTYMFAHTEFWHIFLNMYSLFIFGSVLERVIGSRKMLVYYILCGLGAAAVHTLVLWLQASHFGASGNMAAYYSLLGTPTLGASGSVYGLLIGYGMIYPESVLTLIFPPVSLKAKWFVAIFAVIELLTGVFMTSDGVAHFAHLGGMLFGALLILFWKRTRRLYDEDRWI